MMTANTFGEESQGLRSPENRTAEEMIAHITIGWSPPADGAAIKAAIRILEKSGHNDEERSANQDRVAYLRFYSGLYEGSPLTYKEIAKKFGKSRTNIGKILERGIQLVHHIVEARKTPESSDPLDSPVISLELPPRAYNVVTNRGCRTFRDVCKLTEEELLRDRQIGSGLVEEIRTALEKKGLAFASVSE